MLNFIKTCSLNFCREVCKTVNDPLNVAYIVIRILVSTKLLYWQSNACDAKTSLVSLTSSSERQPEECLYSGM